MIRTERLLLRPGRLTDLEPLHRILSDPSVMRYWSRPAHDDIAQTAEFLRYFMDGYGTDGRVEFILEYDGRCIGKAGMWRDPEVGYILNPDYWGQGLAFEAMSAILTEIARRRPDLTRLTADLDPRNTGSIRLLEKLGFTHDRTVIGDYLYGGYEVCDSAYYSLAMPARA
ncbi:GNAT family N-acetyltransferase [Antarctobacter sp.]|uniref:GNAT family N-acetyltransferase n=1 Tax=Antarctobacter sp. TaxID=1872577 RepID=UPI002B26BDC2|nr:GNAT family N-acetyltransferase [Antarctobacter sp.]